MIQIGELKLLYDLHKQEIDEEDLTRAVISVYLREPSVVRYYREKLFEKIAKRAIE